MMREEFVQMVEEVSKKPLSLSDEKWYVINLVYTFHPSIDEVEGKMQIVNLFVDLGYRVILDMLDTAKRVKKIDEEISDLERAIMSKKQERYDLVNVNETGAIF